MESIPKFLASMITIIVGVLLCVSFVIASVVVNSARTYHSSVIEELEASGFDEVIIQKCIEAAEQDNYDLTIEEVTSAESGSEGFYKVTLNYKLSAPILGSVHNGELIGYASKGTRVVSKLKPGLYLTGSDYGVLLKSWDELVSEGTLSVTDGVVTTGFTSGDNASSDALAGDLLLPFDDSVTEVGDLAFIKCTELTGVRIPDNVKTIGRQAFDTCHVLGTVDLGSGIELIESDAFNYDGMIQIVTYNGNADDWCKITFANGKSNPVCYGSILHLTEEPIINFNDLVIPSTVTSLDSKFSGCENLLSVVIPDDTQLTIIDDAAFGKCSNLRRVRIGSGVEKIGRTAFSECDLKLIMIPESVVEIDSNAFYNCKNLTDIYYYGNLDQWLAISFGSQWDRSTPNYKVHFASGGSMTKETIEAERLAREEAATGGEATEASAA